MASEDLLEGAIGNVPPHDQLVGGPRANWFAQVWLEQVVRPFGRSI